MRRRNRKAPYCKIVLRLPDLDQAKSAVLNSLSSPCSRRNYKFAMEQFIRYAAAVDHHHALRTFPATGLANSEAFFSRPRKSRPERPPPSPATCVRPSASAASATPAARCLVLPTASIVASRFRGDSVGPAHWSPVARSAGGGSGRLDR